MANKRIIEVPETKGEFKLRGLVTGTLKDKFFESKLTKTQVPMNLVKFGVTTDEDNTVYLDLNGMEREEVFFYKKAEEKGGKGETKRIPWNKRGSFNEEGFTLIGTKVGLTKTTNDKGKEVNDTHTYAEYDACEVIADNLQDDMSLFVKGNMEFSSFVNDKNEIRRNTKFVPNQITLTSKPLDFEAEDFEPMSDFQQVIIYVGSEIDNNDKDDVKGVIQAKIITYSTIEDVEFILRDQSLFKTIKKNMKPYTAIKVWGVIKNKVEIEEETNAWGSKNKFDSVNKTFIRELEIIGADPSTIDTETYSEKEIEKALNAIKESKRAKEEFGDKNKDSWGSSGKDSKDEEELEGWE